MGNTEKKDIVDKINDYLLSNKKPMKSKVKNDRHINVRLPNELLESLNQWSYENNRSLSHTIRGFLWFSQLEILQDLREWVFNQDDDRNINNVLKPKSKEDENDG